MKKQILIIKHGALGDLIQAFDAFYSIRKSFKNHTITLLTSSKFKNFMEKTNWFDKILIDDRLPIWKIYYIIKISSIFKKPWDKIIDLQCSKRTGFYFKFSNKKTNWFGIAKGCSHPMPNFDGINNRERMIVAAKLAGSKISRPKLSWLYKTKINFKIPKSYCLFIASCSPNKPSKRWDEKNYIFLAKKFFNMNIIPCLIGTLDDKEINEKILQNAPFCIDLTDKTNFFELAILASKAKFVIGNDTGPTFLAARTNTTTVMIMGNDTDPNMSAPSGKKAFWFKSNGINNVKRCEVLNKIKNSL